MNPPKEEQSYSDFCGHSDEIEQRIMRQLLFLVFQDPIMEAFDRRTCPACCSACEERSAYFAPIFFTVIRCSSDCGFHLWMESITGLGQKANGFKTSRSEIDAFLELHKESFPDTVGQINVLFDINNLI